MLGARLTRAQIAAIARSCARGSDHAGIARAALRFAQVAVESHAHHAHQQPAARGDDDRLAVRFDQTVALQFGQLPALGREITPRVDAQASAKFVERQAEAAGQVLDRLPARQVVGAQAVAALLG